MELTRLIVKGGVISPGELREVVNIAMDQGLDSISFGSRQDIIFPKGLKSSDKEKLGKHHFVFPDQTSGTILFLPMFLLIFSGILTGLPAICFYIF